VSAFSSPDKNIETRTRRPLRFHQNDLPRIHVKFGISLLMLQHAQLFDRDLVSRSSIAASVFHSQFPLQNVCNHRADGKEVVGIAGH
jgi:hypothetical protein